MIIIHAKGNKQLGIGNLSRSYELFLHLSKEYDVLAIFECSKELYKRYTKKNIFNSEKLEDSLSIMSKYKNILYVCDLADANKFLNEKLKKIDIKKSFYFNDLKNGFIPDIFFLTDSFNYPFEQNDFKVYRGFEYYIIGNQIVKNRKKEFNPKKVVRNILICFGGADPAFFTEYLSKEIKDDRFIYTVILGPAMNKSRRETIKNIKKNNIKYIENPSNMLELYKSNDLLVTLGGMMTYEAMCLGLPVCAIRWNYLSYIVKSFGEEKMIIDLGDIEEAYENLLNINIEDANNIAQNSYKRIDGSALKNIENILQENL